MGSLIGAAPLVRRHSELDQLRARVALLERRLTELERPTRLPLADALRPLDPSQRRVAELVALGFTNDEVAARLCFSTKTIEWHLTRIYRKLGLRSRTELAARCRSRETPGFSPARVCDLACRPAHPIAG
ncbi:MAG TPA: helix-turn-helix transcriptional regulator [Gaiellaceae bacterium]